MNLLTSIAKSLFTKFDFPKLFKQFLIWRTKHIKNKQWILFLAALCGFAAGLAAVTIKNVVHLVEKGLTYRLDKYLHFLYFLYPLVGILITVTIIKFVLKAPVGHGIPNTLYAISKGNGIMKARAMFASVITSAFTVGFGGSAGLEGPSVGTTAAIGSNIGRLFRTNYKTRKLLIGCAAAGALASLFNAPIAAIVFASEVLMIDFTTASLVPLLLASASAALTSRFFMGDDVLFHFKLQDIFSFAEVPYYVLLGVVGGVFSMYFAYVYFFVSTSFDRIKNTYLKATVGGVLLGGLIFLMPPLYGEGYGFVNHLIEGDIREALFDIDLENLYNNEPLLIGVLLAIVLFKVFATILTFKAGGVGGIFAPSLFMGGTMGFLFTRVINYFNFAHISQSNFTLVGMAGVMAGVLHAPLTAVFLIAELTGGYELFVPLMITSSIAFFTVKLVVPYSVYTMQLAKRGELITHDKDQAVLTMMKLEKEIEKDFLLVSPYETLGQMIKTVSKSKRNLFPVVDKDRYLLGVVLLDDIREIMFNRDQYTNTYVHELMSIPPDYIEISDNMDAVMRKFEQTGAWNLPVTQDGKYIGFVSKSKLFNGYRTMLKDFYEDED